jgi:hypothetical protein
MEHLSLVLFEHLTLRQLQRCACVNRRLHAWITRYHSWTRFLSFVDVENSGCFSSPRVSMIEEEATAGQTEALVAHLVIYLSQPKALLDVLFASLPLLRRWPCPARSLCAALMQGQYQHIHTLVEGSSRQAQEMQVVADRSHRDDDETPLFGWTRCVLDANHVTYQQRHFPKPRWSSLDHLCLRLHLFEAMVDGLSWEQLVTSHRVAPFTFCGHRSHTAPRGLLGYNLKVPRNRLIGCEGSHPLPDIYQHPCPVDLNALSTQFHNLATLDMQLHGGTGSLFHALTWDPTFPCHSPPEEVFEYLCRARSPTQDILAFVRIWRRNFGLRAQSPAYCLDCRTWFCQHHGRLAPKTSDGLLTRRVDLSGPNAAGDRLEIYGCFTQRLSYDTLSLAKYFAQDTDLALRRNMERRPDNAQDRYELLVHGRVLREQACHGRSHSHGGGVHVVAPRVWFYDAVLEAWRPMGSHGKCLSSRGVRLQKTCSAPQKPSSLDSSPETPPPPFPWHVREWWEQRNFAIRLFDNQESALEYMRGQSM